MNKLTPNHCDGEIMFNDAATNRLPEFQYEIILENYSFPKQFFNTFFLLVISSRCKVQKITCIFFADFNS